MSANLDIELLRTFHAILRFGRFLAAASHLNRSPSAVSTHVRRLEELAGGRLFERDNQSVRLTPLGQRFQRQTAELLETHDRVLAGLRRREEPLRVRFGISEEYAGKLLGPDRVKTQQTMTINFRGFSQRLGGRRRPNQAQSIILVAMALSASVRLLEGGTSRRTGLRPSSLPSGHRCPARSTRV